MTSHHCLLPLWLASWALGLVLSVAANAQQPSPATQARAGNTAVSRATSPIAWLDRRQIDRALAQPLKITLQDVPAREALRTTQLGHSSRHLARPANRPQPTDPAETSRSHPGRNIDDYRPAAGRRSRPCGTGDLCGASSDGRFAGHPRALLEEHAAKLPKSERQPWAHEKQTSWPYPTAVSEIWSQATADGPRRLADLATSPELPHDLWPDQSLPPMRMGELLTLILSGFDLHLRPQPDGGWSLAANGDQPPTIAREYEIPSALQPALQQLAQQHNRSTTQRRGPKVTVDGPWEMHEALRQLLQTDRRPTGDNNTTGDRRSGTGQQGTGQQGTGRQGTRAAGATTRIGTARSPTAAARAGPAPAGRTAVLGRTPAADVRHTGRIDSSARSTRDARSE